MVVGNKKYRVLITSAGGLVGVFLQKHLCKFEEYYLVGTDMKEGVPREKCWDAFYKTSKSSDINFKYEMEKIIKKENIDIIIPVSSYDMDIFTLDEMRSYILPAKMLVMEHDMHVLLHNKKTCCEFLGKLGICTPQIYSDDYIFPCIMKPNCSSGSRDIIILNNEKDYIYWREKIDNYSLFEYLEGDEYTVDCLFDENGMCLGYNSRKREKINGGGVVVTTCVYVKRLETIINKLESCKRIKGPVNFQFKINNNNIYIFDFNTRFASGGLPLSVNSGFDIPRKLISTVMGQSSTIWKQSSHNDGLTMLRYYEEEFIKR